MEARWSPEYLQRKEMMRSLEVPTISQTKEIVGLPLALVLFEQCHEDLKADFGLEPYLEGPLGDLWVSPSDLLIGKVALTPPLTQKHIQALTHQGILELGAEIEQKYWNEMEIEKEKALREREDMLQRIFEAEKITLLEDLKRELEMKHGEELDEMRSYFEDKINQILIECYEQVQRLEEEMESGSAMLNKIWEEKLDCAVKDTVEKMTTEFLEKIGKQEKVLADIFNKKIRMVNAKKKCAIDIERAKCREVLLQMKHQLHCQNITNLMYLLCKERRACKKTKSEMEDDYTSQIRRLDKDLSVREKQIRRLLSIKDRKIRQLKVRETCLKEILKQFQKFIYYALKATPTQGEFLLNINRLIRYELEDYCLPKDAADSKESVKPRETVEEIEESEPEDLTQEYLDEIFQINEEELEYSDDFPALYFNDKIYVREDFRDMVLAGVDGERDHPIWNPDAEELINIFKKSVEDERPCQLYRIKSHHSSVHFIETDRQRDRKRSVSSTSLSAQLRTVSPEHSPPGSPRRQTPAEWDFPKSVSVVVERLKRSHSVDVEREMRRVSLDVEEAGTKKKAKAALIVDDKDEKEQPTTSGMAPTNMTMSRLTLARDSLILHISTMERKSLAAISKLDDQESEINATVEVIPPKEDGGSEMTEEEQQEGEMINAQSQTSLIKHGVTRHTSKLLLATDSYELIKSQIGLVSQKDKDEASTSTPTELTPKRISQLTFGTKQIIKAPPAKKPKPTPIPYKKILKPPPSKLKKPITQQKAKVAGSTKSKVHTQPPVEFTEERIHSLVNIMKDNPSLIRLFTPCSR